MKNENKTRETPPAFAIKLEIITPEGMVFTGTVDSVMLPGISGRFTVLPGHMPMITVLDRGRLFYTIAHRQRMLEIGPGMAQIEQHTVTVLVENAE